MVLFVIVLEGQGLKNVMMKQKRKNKLNLLVEIKKRYVIKLNKFKLYIYIFNFKSCPLCNEVVKSTDQKTIESGVEWHQDCYRKTKEEKQYTSDINNGKLLILFLSILI